MLEAKAKEQGHKHQCSPKNSQKFFRRFPQKNVFQKIFQALHKILTIQKIVLSSSRGLVNFRGLEASRPRPRNPTFEAKAKDFKICPRGQGRPRGLHLCRLHFARVHSHLQELDF